VLHSFTGGQDGEEPYAGVSTDRAGNLYGTAPAGGNRESDCYGSCGTVYRVVHTGSGWLFSPLYDFLGGADGSDPMAGVTIGPDGNVYGVTSAGGGGCETNYGCGTVFKLSPPARICRSTLCPWTETALYRFASDNMADPNGAVIFDAAGNIYGTAATGGTGGSGAIYELSPSSGGWTATILYSFTGGNDGAIPMSGLTMDRAGTLYGTTLFGGSEANGTVFQLVRSGASWTLNTLHTFLGGDDGSNPQAGVILAAAGNLYGDTSGGGTRYGGVGFELTRSGGVWAYTVITNFYGGISSNLAFDAAGNLYGTTYAGGSNDDGAVIQLAPSGNGTWTQNVAHSFGGRDGALPIGSVLVAPNGNFYGTATAGGTGGQGVVWEMVP
jgi:uncharacterized repeat protein (TIGR03803 family)